jgi:hypothetical protein
LKWNGTFGVIRNHLFMKATEFSDGQTASHRVGVAHATDLQRLQTKSSLRGASSYVMWLRWG